MAWPARVFRQARGQLRREQEDENSERIEEPEAEADQEVPLTLEAEEIVRRGRQGRDAWFAGGQAPARAASLG